MNLDKQIKKYITETIKWVDGKIAIIDQTLLPEKYKIIKCSTIQELGEAIKRLSVRGAPALGVAGAYGMLLSIWNKKYKNIEQMENDLNNAKKYIDATRPTAINLSWGTERIVRYLKKIINDNFNEKYYKEELLKYADHIFYDDIIRSAKIGKNGLEVIDNNDTILTHCNAGALATAGLGTALSVIFYAYEYKKNIQVYVDETRPLLQGARLSAWELKRAGIPITLNCDNMAGLLMKDGKITKVIVGADRIAANGDTANKIGTYSLAVLSAHHGIPFYIAAPLSTFDMNIKTGKEIPIEERNPDEISFWHKTIRTAPKDIKIYNPAFDVTPYSLITGIITEKGILRSPYSDTIKAII